MMNVREVAAYLNLKDRKIYDLVRTGSIPCSRVTGKWLFPLDLIDQWVASGVAGGPVPSGAVRSGTIQSQALEQALAGGAGGEAAGRPVPPPVVAGSHDPLLEWALRESACGLALLPCGSLAGLEHLRGGDAQVCGLHVFEPPTAEYNRPSIHANFGAAPVILIEWAWRSQGLVVAPGNPLNIQGMADLRNQAVRVVMREPESGTWILFGHLLRKIGSEIGEIKIAPRVARTQMEAALAVLEGGADAGLCVEAAARQLRLDFIPLHRERYDLALFRREYFEPPFQRLLAFAKGAAFQERAGELGGYEIGGLGTVHHNGP